MTNKFTPGPWIWGSGYRGLYGAGPDNEVLDYEPYENMWLAHTEHREANARLIAAAPALLEALQVCLDYGSMTGSAWVEDQAREAIKQALG